jgi:L-asparagine transporter-like permease
LDIGSHYLVNSALCWLVVIMAATGYFLTVRRLRQRWAFWVVLIIGWAFLAISNTLSALSIGQGTYFPAAIWLTSYVMVIASLVLLFLKLIQVMETGKKSTRKENTGFLPLGQGGFRKEM